jgi:hypothetical protein
MARHKNPLYKKEDLLRMIVEWKAEGQMHNTIIAKIKELNYSIDYAYALLREAKPLIMETLKDIAKDRIETTITELETLKHEASIAEDLNLVLQIQKEINKISGLHKENLDITSDGKAIENIQVIKITEYIKPNKTEEHE